MYPKWVRFHSAQPDSKLLLKLRRRQSLARAICLLGMCAMAGVAWPQQQERANPPAVAGDSASRDVVKPSATDQAPSGLTGGNTAGSIDALGDERKREIAGQSSKLLQMAKDLKTEMDMTTDNTLSVAVFRKVDAIEKLTQYVKDQSKHANKK